MRWRKLLARGRALLGAERVHHEIDEELAFHIDMRARDYERQGMSPQAARTAARRSFGSTARIKDVSYDIRGGGRVERVWRDIVYAVRRLRRQPTLTAVIIAVVAIGVGANAAILGVADHVLWRELPVRAPGELVQLAVAHGPIASESGEGESPAFSYPMWRALQASGAFSNVLARWRQPATFSVGETTERSVVEMVSGNYFDMLGVRAGSGRLFSAQDDATMMAHPVVVLSDRYWRRRFNADASVIGKTIRIDDYPLTIVGVAPREFTGIEVGVFPDAWVPLAMHPVLFSARRSLVDDDWMWLDLVARPAPGAAVALTETRATAAVRRLSEQAGWPTEAVARERVRLVSASHGLSPLRTLIGPSLVALMGIAVLVLLIACANVATLLVVRSMARRRELGVRLALGASRMRIGRQLCIESLILAIIGGAIGSVLAIRGAHVLVGFIPPTELPMELDLTPDARALAISLALSTVTGLLFGVAPAFAASRIDPAIVIRDELRVRRGRGWRVDPRRVVVAMQIALSVVLIVAAGLFARTVAKLAAVPMGFAIDNVIMASLDPSQNRYDSRSGAVFYKSLETRLAAIPGVQAVGSAVEPLLGGENSYNMRTVRSAGHMRPEGGPGVLVHTVSPGYFAATGLEVLHGRALGAGDVAGAALVTLLNESAAHKYFEDGDAVGKSVIFSAKERPIVVGVVRDAKYRTVREQAPPTLYTTFEQDSDMVSGLERTLYVRTTSDPKQIETTLRAIVRDLDPSIPVFGLQTLREQKRRAMSNERVVALLSGIAAGVALLLAAIGLYGLVMFDMQRRTHEIGVRISLGATSGRIVALAMRGATVMVLCGLIAGVTASRVMSRFVTAELFGVSANDPLALLLACTSLAGVAFIATLLPAWRATNVSPLEALRCE